MQTNSWFGSLTPVVKNLIIINVLCWLAALSLLRLTGVHLEDWLGLHYWQASRFNPAQLVSYMFLHATGRIDHLFFNMFGLFMFGRVLEQYWGAKRFLLYYMVTGIGAGIVQEITWTIDLLPMTHEISGFVADGIEGGVKVDSNTILYSVPELLAWKDEVLNQFITIGASGAIFALLLGFGMLFPEQPVFLMFIPIPIKAKYFVVGYAVIELFLGVGNFSFDNVAHFAHLGGMLFGFFLIKYWRKNPYK